MIFLSLGTHHHAFERALDLVLPLVRDGNRLVVQHGQTPPRLEVPNVEWHQYLPRDAMVSYIESSESFICHAGVGSVLTAMSVGAVPVVIPRTNRRREHVDAHQESFARELDRRGLVVAVLDPETDLAGAIAKAGAVRVRRAVLGSGPLVDVIGAALADR